MTNITESLICLDNREAEICVGAVDYRPAMSPTGREFPRCERHFKSRLREQERISRTYGTPMYYY